MFFLLAFVLVMGGIALLVVGEFTWLGGKKIPPRTGRQVGAVLVSFLPIAIVARFVLHKLDPEESVEPAVVYGSVAGLVAVTGLFLVLRAARRPAGKRAARGAALGSAANPFEAPALDAGEGAVPSQAADSAAWAPPSVAASKKKPRPAGGRSPFDFG